MTWDQLRADLARALESVFPDDADAMMTRIEQEFTYRADNAAPIDSVTQKAFLSDLAVAVGDSFPDRADRILHKLQRVLERPEDRGNVTVCAMATHSLKFDRGGQPRFIVLASSPPSMVGRSFVVDRERMLVGRASGCDFVVPDDTFSRRHFEITFESGRVSITDQRSTNGTFVNHFQIPPLTDVPLNAGDQVRAADVVFAFAGTAGFESLTSGRSPGSRC